MSTTSTGGSSQGTGLAPNLASLLCYFCPPITGIIFMIIEKENKDILFHSWQSTLFGIVSFVFMVGLKIVAAFMGYIWSVLGFLVGLTSWVILMAIFIAWIVCLIKSYQGERWKIPVIGDFAEQKAGSV